MEGGGHWLFLGYQLINLRIGEMCRYAVRENPDMMFEFVPDEFKSQSMCDEVVFENPLLVKDVPDKYKTREMCETSCV